MIRAKKMTDKVGLETFWGSHSIFVIIYETAERSDSLFLDR